MKHRRLVNLHLTGPYAGIAHIHGVENEPTPRADVDMPLLVDLTLLDGRLMPCEVVRFTERAVYYREVAA